MNAKEIRDTVAKSVEQILSRSSDITEQKDITPEAVALATLSFAAIALVMIQGETAAQLAELNEHIKWIRDGNSICVQVAEK
jgi:hypothetical protein